MPNYADEEGEPRGPGGLPCIDMSTGIFNALGVVAALYHRSQTGAGQKIETSLFSTGLALQSMGMVHVDKLDRASHEKEKHTSKQLTTKTKRIRKLLMSLPSFACVTTSRIPPGPSKCSTAITGPQVATFIPTIAFTRLATAFEHCCAKRCPTQKSSAPLWGLPTITRR